jgi:hypothetical protein
MSEFLNQRVFAESVCIQNLSKWNVASTIFISYYMTCSFDNKLLLLIGK